MSIHISSLFSILHFSDSPSSLPLASDLDRSILTATPEEMRNALSQSYITGDSCLMGVAEACFSWITPWTLMQSKKYAIKQINTRFSFFPSLSHIQFCASVLKNSRNLPRMPRRALTTELMILASTQSCTQGRNTFQAESDVLLLSPFFRGMLYQVGSAEAPNEEMLLQGSTFVPARP